MVNRTKVELDIRNFAQKYPLATYKKGAVIVRPGTNPDEAFFIVQGKVNQFDIAPNGNEVVVNVFAKPAFLSIFWIFDAADNRFTYKAVSDVRVHRAPKSDVQKFMLANPEIMFATLQRVVRGLDGFMIRMAYQLYGSAEKKIAIEILLEAKRFHKLETKNIKLESSVNDLTARTGLARETVSRQIASLLQKELIKKKNNLILITDLDTLEAYIAAE